MAEKHDATYHPNDGPNPTLQVTDEQRAAWGRLTGKNAPTLIRGKQGPTMWDDLAAVAPLLPDELTAQPGAPTAPGAYHDPDEHLFVLTPWGKWLTAFGDTMTVARLPLPLTPLVKARPPLTPDAFLAKWSSIGFASEETRCALAEAAVDLVNGADQ